MCYIDCHCHHAAADGVIAIRSFDADELPPSAVGPLTAGIHPWHTAAGRDYATELLLLEAAAAAGRLLAIGECGLDRRRGAPLPEQRTVFRRQLELAGRHGLPVVIHCVRAWPELLAIKKDFPKQRWLIHGFNGRPELAATLAAAGCYLAFGRTLISSERLKICLAALPEDRIMLETDDFSGDIKEVYSAATVACRAFPADLKRQLQVNFTIFFGKDFHEYQ